MKRLILSFFAVAVMALASAQEIKTAALTLPAGAKMVEPFTYKYTDAQGKKWVYRETPFGLVRFEDKPEQDKAAPAELESVIATVDGDNVAFERKGPFGKYHWTRKKSELTDFEKQVLAKRASDSPGVKE